jgi:multidrug efflux system outer membrane protein
MKSRALFVLALCVSVSGCYSLRAPLSESNAGRDLPFVAPKLWSAAPQSGFDQKSSSPATPDAYFGAHFPGFNYNTLIQTALKGNYALRQLDSQLASQIAKHKSERSRLWPSVVAGLNGQDTRIEDSTTKLFALQGDVSWTVDLWGTQRLLAHAAKYSTEEASLSREAGQLSVAAAALQNWFEWCSKEKLYQLQRDFVKTLETSSELVENRFNTGLADLVGLRLAHTEIALARSDLLQKRSAAINARSRFQELLGENHKRQQEEKLYGQLAFTLPEQASPLPGYLPADIIRQRPDLLAAERRLKSQELKLLSSKNAWLPSLNLNASQGLQNQSLNNVLKNGLSVSAIAFNLMQPVFNAGAIKAQQAQARAAVSNELYAYSELLHRAMLEVDRLLLQDNVLKQQMSAAKFAAHLASETQSLAQRNYNAGLTDLNTFLDAHRNSINTETRRVSVTNDWLQNRVNLLLALGAHPNSSLDTIGTGSAGNIHTVDPSKKTALSEKLNDAPKY